MGREYLPTFRSLNVVSFHLSCIDNPYMEHLGYVKAAGFWKELPCSPPCQIIVNFHKGCIGVHLGFTPPPRIPVTTRMITLLVGNPYKTFLATATAWEGANPRQSTTSYLVGAQPPLLLICSSFTRENAYPLRILLIAKHCPAMSFILILNSCIILPRENKNDVPDTIGPTEKQHRNSLTMGQICSCHL